jgi:phage/plasmid-associated DNA primase
MRDTTPFAPAWIRWYNSAGGAKIGCVGKIEDIPYGSVSHLEFHARDAPPHPVHGQYQWGHACSITSRTIGNDGDYPDKWAATAYGRLVGPWQDVATSVREVGDGTFRFHVMEQVPVELLALWPKMLPAAYGHIKSNGFTYVEGIHATGTKYIPTGKPWLVATEATMRAHLEDNGGVLHTDSNVAQSDSFEDESAEWRDAYGTYPAHLREAVLGGSWAEGGRNDSLPWRCGLIKAAGQKGTPGMGTLFHELCAEYDAATGRGESDVYRAFSRCHAAYDKTENLSSTAFLASLGTTPEQIAARQVPAVNGNGNGPEVQPAPITNESQQQPEAAPEPVVNNAHNFAGTSDQSCARLVLESTGQGLRYAKDADTWLMRGKECWSTEKTGAGAVIAAMRNTMPAGDPHTGVKTADLTPEMQIEICQSKRRTRFGADAGAKAIAGKMKSVAMVSWGNGDQSMAVQIGDLDQDPGILWAGGIPWDLRASVHCPVQAQLDPATPHLHHARCVPDMAVRTPLWDAFTWAVWPEADLHWWALRVLGQGVTGYAGKSLPVLLGPTDRGKTQIVKLIADVLGTYGLGAADARLLSAADRAHASIVYALKGVRLALIDEAPRTGKLANERLKQLAGGGDLTGNRMGENPVTFRSTHTLVLTANQDHEPVLTDPAIAGRVRLIPCEGDRDAVIKARAAIGDTSDPAWRTEAPGVLAQMMAEGGRYLADPSSAGNEASPEYVQQQVTALAEGQCPVTAWLEECERYAAGTRSHELYQAFVQSWRKTGGVGEPYTETRWGRTLNEAGYPSTPRMDGKYRPLRMRLPGLAQFTSNGYGAYGAYGA